VRPRPSTPSSGATSGGAQEVFVRVYTRADRYDPASPFKAWLYRIATNVAIDLGRKRRRRRWVSMGETLFRVADRTSVAAGTQGGGLADEPACSEDGALSCLLHDERATLVRSAIGTLPEKYRHVLVLRDLHDLSYEEIARTLECRVGTVKSRMYQAVRLLRTELERDAPDSGCCGMAGSFGFNKAHYDLSMSIGERVLLPTVRQLDEDALIIADGFSCREQIAHGSGRHVSHLAEVLAIGSERSSD